jgi:TRAP-type C4-dicarboxylate transport system permease small subunit
MIKILDRISDTLAALGGLLLIFATVSIVYSIFTRAIGVSTPIWVVQFNEYSMLWIPFLGAAWLLAKDKHVSIQILTIRLSVKWKKILKTCIDILGFLICLALFYYCAKSTYDLFVRKIIDVQAIDVPKAYVVIIIPVGFLMLFLQFIRRIYEDFSGKNITKEGLAVEHKHEGVA